MVKYIYPVYSETQKKPSSMTHLPDWPITSNVTTLPLYVLNLTPLFLSRSPFPFVVVCETAAWANNVPMVPGQLYYMSVSLAFFSSPPCVRPLGTRCIIFTRVYHQHSVQERKRQFIYRNISAGYPVTWAERIKNNHQHKVSLCAPFVAMACECVSYLTKKQPQMADKYFPQLLALLFSQIMASIETRNNKQQLHLFSQSFSLLLTVINS